MRGLLRRRRERGLVAAALIVSAIGLHSGAARGAADHPLTVAITSPLGRSGLPGKLRIVARVTYPKDSPAPSVRFFVDNVQF